MIVELVLLVVMLLVYAAYKDRKPSKMPPGPSEIPFIGQAPVQYTSEMEGYRKKYGNIFTTRLGNSRIVIVSDYKTAKEALASIDFVDRPPFFTLFNINPNEQGGVVSSNGLPWVHDRRFVLRNLRDLGMGKTYLEQAISIEAQAIVDHIKSLDEKPSLHPRCLRTAVLNIIWQMTTGKRYDLQSKEVDGIFTVVEDFREQSFYMFLDAFFPVLHFLPQPVLGYLIGAKVLAEFRKEMHSLIQATIDEHDENLNENDPRDLIDDYLIDMKKEKKSEETQFSIGALEQIVSDLFGAGSDTVTNSMKWVVYYMYNFPDKAKRAQELIDNVVPRDRLVSLNDRSELGFVEAFVAETLRHSSMIYMGVQRSATRDTFLNGYFIPKGTILNTNSYFIHHDPEFWDKPNEFVPERYLNEDGVFQTKFGRTVAFGSGRRQCAGEALARMELYLFTAAMLQNFTIELPKGRTFSHAVVESVGTRFPTDQELIYKIRK